jgi:hypothetical protein
MSDEALACIDSFKTGFCGCGCGCIPCLNNRPPLGPKCRALPAPVIVHDNKGGCVPLVRGGDFVHSCKKSGDMTIRAPGYFLTIENPADDVERNADGSPVIVDGKVVAKNTQPEHC